jgi:ubiquinone/menaquinone biosynthesis C-methylase UbiE
LAQPLFAPSILLLLPLSIEMRCPCGDAQALPFPDEQFDTVVSTLTLCSIPDEHQAIAEAWRVLRPGGRLLLLEHVRSPNRLVQSVERLLNPLTVRLQADHLTREPLDAVDAVGFTVEQVLHSRLGIVERVLARKP